MYQLSQEAVLTSFVPKRGSTSKMAYFMCMRITIQWGNALVYHTPISYFRFSLLTSCVDVREYFFEVHLIVTW